MKKQYIYLTVILSACFLGQCTQSNAVDSEAVKQGYPKLYEAVFNRSYTQIIPFTNSSSDVVRRQAWRSLAQTPIDSIAGFIEKVITNASDVSWFALSMHKLSAAQLRSLEQYWVETPDQRAGISLVLGRQGDKETFQFLLEHSKDALGSDYEPSIALAVGRLFLTQNVTSHQHLEIINNAFASDNAGLITKWLYGFYRKDGVRLTSEAIRTMKKKWETYGIGNNALVDQYVAKILTGHVFTEIINYYHAQEALEDEVQLGVELAKVMAKIPLLVEDQEAAKVLLEMPNPHVVRLTLESLEGRLNPQNELISLIETNIIDNPNTKPYIGLQAFETVVSVKPEYVNNFSLPVLKITTEHPYRSPKLFQFIADYDSPAAFLNVIATVVSKHKPLPSLFAIQALDRFWQGLENKKDYLSAVRPILFDALTIHDKSIVFSSQGLLMDSLLINSNDFSLINKSLSHFKLPADMEVYQTFGRLYKNKFEQQAKPLIDSLSTLGYASLNRALNRAGWDVPLPTKAEKSGFRTPDWSRLWELGKHPVWVLETDKGVIKIKLNTLSAPATVSAIDSLTQSGAYDGVPFHRVVPNFVIQGGDVSLGTGYGGSDFTIPTEPSETVFVRGALGIASAGTDTEGSQYFIMNQWSPHLNARYTLFGSVIEGMSVVDRIIVGDVVKKAYWEVND